MDRWAIGPDQPGSPASAELIEKRQLSEFKTPALDGVITSEEVIAGVDCLVVSVLKPTSTLLHFHGGGFRLGWARTWLNYASDIAIQANCRVVVPTYRLAPEFPYPAALRDALEVYEELHASGVVVIGGDSAGGALAVSLAMMARLHSLTMPAGLVLMSPWLDLSVTTNSYRDNSKSDAMFSENAAKEAAAAYLGTVSAYDPIASPFHGDVVGLPPTIIFVSKSEVLLDDSINFAHSLSDHGVAVELFVSENMSHIWPVILLDQDQTKDARKNIAEFIQRVAI
ncbi:MAG: alpha/beta hydrolase [Ilumatobacteraceae bacterium]|nr:alpha/beta hydrolase [Ilumatobacteraceae bacterium]